MARYGTPNKTWDELYAGVEDPFSYGGDTAYIKGMEFLDHEGWTVEDWGCGTTYAAKFLHHAIYRGIDFTPSAFVDEVADLLTYRSKPEAIFMRGVLEHNPEWRTILRNAVESFTERFALITFIPFENEDRYINTDWPTLALCKTDFDNILSDLEVRRFDIATVSEFGQESVFLCTSKRKKAN